MKALDRLAVRSTTTITKTTPQASVEVMIDLLPIELMVQKVGISAYIRLKSQLNNPCAALNTRHIPHMQYWEKLIKEYNIKMPQTDECNERVWEKAYNVNLDSLKGGKKHPRH